MAVAGDITLSGNEVNIDGSRISAETTSNAVLLADQIANINIESKVSALNITNSEIIASATGDADAGNIALKSLSEALNIESTTVESTSSSSASSTAGQAGTIDIFGQAINFIGSIFNVETASNNVDSNAIANITLDGGNGAITLTKVTGGLSNQGISASTSGNVEAGSISIKNASDITLDGVTLKSTSETVGSSGNAGSVTLVGIGAVNLLNNVSIETTTDSTGEAGQINITGASVTGSGVTIASASTKANSGKAGAIDITGETISFADGGQISTITNSDINNAEASITLDATAGTLTLTDTTIEGTTTGDANAGDINLYGQSYSQSGGQVVTSSGKDLNEDELFDIDEVGSGNAGNITIAKSKTSDDPETFEKLEAFSLINGGHIKAVTEGAGDAGGITIHNAGSMTIAGTVDNLAEISVAANDVTAGNAGSLILSGTDVLIDYAKIEASTESTANTDSERVLTAASIDITATGRFELSNSEILASTTGGVAAGDVTLTAQNQALNIESTKVESTSESTSETAGQAGSISVFGKAINFIGSLLNVETESDNTANNAIADITLDGLGGSVTLQHSASGLAQQGISASTAGNVNAGSITIHNASDITLDSLTLSSKSQTVGSRGSAGSVSLAGTGIIDLKNGATIETNTASTGEAGKISITGASVSGSAVTIESASTEINSGKAGAIAITGGTVAFTNGSQISTVTNSNIGNPSATITLNSTSGTLSLSDTSIEGSTTGNANAGDINLYGQNYSQSGGQVVTSSGKDQNVGLGNAGNITIAKNSNLDAVDAFSLTNGGDIKAVTEGTGDAGGISIYNAGVMSIVGTTGNQAEISLAANDATSGSAGDLALSGSDITIDHAKISASSASTANTDDGRELSAASISITASGEFDLTNSNIIASTTGDVAAGNITLTAQNQALNIDSSKVESTSISTSATAGQAGSISVFGKAINFVSSLFSVATASNNSSNTAANITLDSSGGAITLHGDSTEGLFASTTGKADAGSIYLKNASDVTLKGVALKTETSNAGNAGSIDIEASRAISLSNDASLETNTSGSGDAGTIKLEGSNLSINDALIASQSTGGQSGQAGSISLQSGTTSMVDTTVSTKTGSSASSKQTASIMIASTSGDLSLTNTAVEGSTSGGNDAGDINLSASGQANIVGTDVKSQSTGAGNAGSISLIANGIELIQSLFDTNTQSNKLNATASIILDSQGGAMSLTGTDLDRHGLSASTSGAANAGSIQLQNASDINFNGVALKTNTTGAGHAGTITASGITLSANDALIASQSRGEQSGQAGSIDLQAGTVSLVDTSISTSTESSAINNQTASITIVSTSGDLSLTNTTIEGSTSSNNDAGNIILSSTGKAFMSDSEVFSSSVSTSTAAGQAGSISLISQAIDFVNTLFNVETASNNTNNTAASIVLDSQSGDISLGGINGSGLTASSTGAADAGSLKIESLGDVNLAAKTVLATNASSAGSAGAIDISGANVTGSGVNIESASTDSTSGKAGAINIAGGVVAFSAASNISTLTDSDNSTNAAASITLHASTGGLSLTETTIEGSTTGNANAGDINLYGQSYSQSAGQVVTSSGKDQNVGSGNAGNITIGKNSNLDLVDSFTITNGGDIRAVTEGAGDAGGISIYNAGEMNISGTQDNKAEISVAANDATSGSAGSLVLSGSKVTFDHVKVAASTASTSSEQALNSANILLEATQGDINLNNTSVLAATSGSVAAGDITFHGDDVTLSQSNIEATTSGSGKAGNIQLGTISNRLQSLTLTNQSNVETSTTGIGDAGAVSIATQSDVTIVSGSSISSAAVENVSTVANVNKAARAQQVVYTSGSAQLNVAKLSTMAQSNETGASGSMLETLATTGDLGSAGQINIDAGGNISLDGGTITTATQSNDNSALTAGDITLTATNQLNLSNNAEINASTQGNADGGSVTLGALALAINSGSSITSKSNTDTNSSASETAGAAGNIDITSSIVKLNSGTISTEAINAGGGNITLNDALTLVAENNSLIEASTTLNTAPRSDISGGQITLNVSDKLNLSNSQLVAKANNTAGQNGFEVQGGSVAINPDSSNSNLQMLMMEGSQINASAVNANGGKVKLNANYVLREAGSSIDVSAAGGLDGTVTNNAPELDESAVIGELIIPLLDASDLLQQACDSSGSRSTFVIRGGNSARVPSMYISGKLPVSTRQGRELADKETDNWESAVPYRLSEDKKVDPSMWMSCQREQGFLTSMLM